MEIKCFLANDAGLRELAEFQNKYPDIKQIEYGEILIQPVPPPSQYTGGYQQQGYPRRTPCLWVLHDTLPLMPTDFEDVPRTKRPSNKPK